MITSLFSRLLNSRAMCSGVGPCSNSSTSLSSVSSREDGKFKVVDNWSPPWEACRPAGGQQIVKIIVCLEALQIHKGLQDLFRQSLVLCKPLQSEKEKSSEISQERQQPQIKQQRLKTLQETTTTIRKRNRDRESMTEWESADLQWRLCQSQFCLQGSWAALIQPVSHRQSQTSPERERGQERRKCFNIYQQRLNFPTVISSLTQPGLEESSASGSPACSCPPLAAVASTTWLIPLDIYRAAAELPSTLSNTANLWNAAGDSIPTGKQLERKCVCTAYWHSWFRFFKNAEFSKSKFTKITQINKKKHSKVNNTVWSSHWPQWWRSIPLQWTSAHLSVCSSINTQHNNSLSLQKQCNTLRSFKLTSSITASLSLMTASKEWICT